MVFLSGVTTALGSSSINTAECSPLRLLMPLSCRAVMHRAVSVSFAPAFKSIKNSPAYCRALRYGRSFLRPVLAVYSWSGRQGLCCRRGVELKAGFRIHLDRQCYIVESGFSSEASGTACESNADSLVRIDPIAFCASKELDKRRCICVCER